MNSGLSADSCTLISGRSDVIMLFSQMRSLQKRIFTVPTFSDGIERASHQLLVDVSSINSFSDSGFISKISIIRTQTLFIVPPDVSFERRKFIYEHVPYYVDLPVEKFALEKLVKEFICSIQKSKKIIHHSFKNEYESLVSYNPLFDSLLGSSYVMQRIRAKILSYAKGKEPVLLLGESGTGKTTAAKLIHKLSDRHSQIYNYLNISTIPTNLAESTFFGQEAGSYTGAVKTEGILAETHNGTLFMDEIATASTDVQSKLLSFLDSGIFSSLGSSLNRKSDVRFIFATNEDLVDKINRREFRKDFYFRIAQNIIQFPALRDHLDDIDEIAPVIAQKKGKRLSEDAIKKLKRYSWPGNIRQLENCIKQAGNLVNGVYIGSDDLEFNF